MKTETKKNASKQTNTAKLNTENLDIKNFDIENKSEALFKKAIHEQYKLDRDQFEILKKKMQNGPMTIRIVSDSMSPLISVDEKLSLFPLMNKKPEKYDIFVYFDGQILICHYFEKEEKVLGQDSPVWIFRPLKYDGEDFPVNPKDILGFVNKKISWTLKCKIHLRRGIKKLFNSR